MPVSGPNLDYYRIEARETFKEIKDLLIKKGIDVCPTFGMQTSIIEQKVYIAQLEKLIEDIFVNQGCLDF